MEEKKIKLKQMLNEAHAMRPIVRNKPTPSSISSMLSISKKCMEMSEELQITHGSGLSLELYYFAKMAELDSLFASSDSDKEEEKTETCRQEYKELEAPLLSAKSIAINFGDVHLATRVLELLANVYRRTDRVEMEVDCIEKAIRLDKTVPKVMALMDGIHRVLVKSDDDTIVTGSDIRSGSILTFNSQYWENYLWLKKQPDFDRDSFIKSKKVIIYKVAVCFFDYFLLLE
eukprot:TRINITY_DN5189_c0_g1_i1.p1 TRINITY_DN5189_c0_g1~~TRINITY_DN5189_c0_g1_i1.p1  ORF type:complete len:239 (-),score=53.89 TRINITY_DN5189_c0_g1_i1:243-935(-)